MFTGRIRDGHAERKRPGGHSGNGYRAQPGTARPAVPVPSTTAGTGR